MYKKKRLPIIPELHQVINQPWPKNCNFTKASRPKESGIEPGSKRHWHEAPLNQGEPMWNLEWFTWSVTVGNWSRLPSTISFRSGLLVLCHEKYQQKFTCFFHVWNLTARILEVPFPPISVQNSYLAETFWLPSWCYQTTFQVVVIKVQGLQFWPNFCNVVLEIMRKRREKGWLLVVVSIQCVWYWCQKKATVNMTLESIL